MNKKQQLEMQISDMKRVRRKSRSPHVRAIYTQKIEAKQNELQQYKKLYSPMYRLRVWGSKFRCLISKFPRR